MFNQSLKKEALEIHENAVNRYNRTYAEMTAACQHLYDIRDNALTNITAVEIFINTIANTPKELDKQLGDIKYQVLQFHQTKEYAKEAYHSAVKSGINVVSGVAAGGAVATAAPSIAMSIATTFGTASTGTAISALSGAAAQKAALAWLGRMTGGLATKGVITGAGMASGQAFLALAGPIGWGVSAAATTLSLVSLTSKNRKISEKAINEAKNIMEARETLRETTAQINQIEEKTIVLNEKLSTLLSALSRYQNMDYLLLADDVQKQLGTLLNNTYSMASLLNTVVE